jgi:hypothetical protein
MSVTYTSAGKLRRPFRPIAAALTWTVAALAGIAVRAASH